MERKITKTMVDWCNQRKRMPLLVYGARQVGKTYAIKAFGEKYFENMVYVNFEVNKDLAAYFEGSISPRSICNLLEKYFQITIKPKSTLIFFDEVQLCERALTSLKYFAEEAPEYCVVAAGSLLGVALHREKYSFPVGKVQFLHAYPLDFEEFLWAKGQSLLSAMIKEHYASNMPMPEALHRSAIHEYYDYLITGGMPAVVMTHINHSDGGIDESSLKEYILAAYIADMSKFASASESVKIANAFASLPVQLGKDNKKFKYKLIKRGGRAAFYGEAIDWLLQAAVVLKCGKVTAGMMPLAMYEDLSSFKLYYNDVGLLAQSIGMTLRGLSLPGNKIFMGAMTENYIAQQLTSLNHKLYYWTSNGTAEIDFLLTQHDRVIPLECKAATHVKSKSLDVYCQDYHPGYSLRVSLRNFGEANNIKSIPLYAVFCL